MQFAELGPTLACSLSDSCFWSGCTLSISEAGGHIYVAAPQAVAIIHKVIPKPPLGNLCLKECLQDFEGIQNFEKQVLGSD